VCDRASLRGDRKAPAYAVTWQIKENVYVDGSDTHRPRKISASIEKVGFRGFLPIERWTGDPKEIVTAFLQKVRKAMA